jgi:hypothetical protein
MCRHRAKAVPRIALMGNTKKQTQATVRIFTLEEAQRTLPLVRRIVTDIVADYRALLAMAEHRDEQRDRGQRRAAIGIEQRTRHLSGRIEERMTELSEIGCELRDWENGIVDFRTYRVGREVCLCWKLGEPTIAHWHETCAGNTARKPLSTFMTDTPNIPRKLKRPIATAGGIRP